MHRTWTGDVSHVTVYTFQCHSLTSLHPRLLPESKSLFFISVSLLLSHIQGHRYHLSKFHVYVFPIMNSPPTSLPIPQGLPSAPAPSTLHHALNLDWRFVSPMILYMFQCHYPKSSHPRLLPESKRLFYTSVSLLLSRTPGYCYHLSKFHIYALVYCIGVFLSGLLHSV